MKAGSKYGQKFNKTGKPHVFFKKNIEKYLLIKNKALPLHRS